MERGGVGPPQRHSLSIGRHYEMFGRLDPEHVHRDTVLRVKVDAGLVVNAGHLRGTRGTAALAHRLALVAHHSSATWTWSLHYAVCMPDAGRSGPHAVVCDGHGKHRLQDIRRDLLGAPAFWPFFGGSMVPLPRTLAPLLPPSKVALESTFKPPPPPPGCAVRLISDCLGLKSGAIGRKCLVAALWASGVGAKNG